MSTNPSPSAPTIAYYPFAQRAAAVLGVTITSAGLLSIFARRLLSDGQGGFRWGANGQMETVYETPTPVVLPPHTSFSLELSRYSRSGLAAVPAQTGKVGLFTIEPLTWIRPYEDNITHMMGFTDPFTPYELDYTGTSRLPTIASNRKFTCTYDGRGNVLIDDEPRNSETILHLHSFDVLDQTLGTVQTAGGVFIAVRVTDAHLDDGCVTLTFPTGPKFDGVIHTPGQPDQPFRQLSVFKLNRTSYGPA